MRLGISLQINSDFLHRDHNFSNFSDEVLIVGEESCGGGADSSDTAMGSRTGGRCHWRLQQANSLGEDGCVGFDSFSTEGNVGYVYI